MKNIIKLVFVTLVFISGQLSAATVTWGPATTTVGVNNVFTMDVVGVGFTSNVDGGGINFSYNSSVLSVLSISIDEYVWDFGAGISTGTIDNVAGTVDGISVNAWSNVTGDFSIASVTFQAINEGTTGLLLSEWGFNPWASGGSAINPDFVDGQVISTVPVPAAVWLFGSGLLGLLGLAKRKTA